MDQLARCLSQFRVRRSAQRAAGGCRNDPDLVKAREDSAQRDSGTDGSIGLQESGPGVVDR